MHLRTHSQNNELQHSNVLSAHTNLVRYLPPETKVSDLMHPIPEEAQKAMGETKQGQVSTVFFLVFVQACQVVRAMVLHS